jgi:hypothetical protein
MDGFIFFLVFFAVVAFFAFFWISLFRSFQLSKKYGPQRQIAGQPVLQGRLICESWKAPTLGRKLEFIYEVNLYASGNDLTGKYVQSAVSKIKPLYIGEGEIFLTYDRGHVEGRTGTRGAAVVVEGDLNPRGANVSIGMPKGTLLGRMRNELQFRIVNNQIVFSKRSLDIGKNSKLYVTDNRISGRLEHHTQAWILNVDTSYRSDQVASELAALVILTIGDSILSHHYD